MHQEKELLGRQQDAMRETAGPRELRTYPTMHRGHTLTHQFYSSVYIFQLRFFSASFFSALPKSNPPIINMTLNYAMHYRSVFCEKEGVVFFTSLQPFTFHKIHKFAYTLFCAVIDFYFDSLQEVISCHPCYLLSLSSFGYLISTHPEPHHS
jgi:hypothetical protein